MDNKDTSRDDHKINSQTSGGHPDKKKVVLGQDDFSDYRGEDKAVEPAEEKGGFFKNIFSKVSDGKGLIFNEDKDKVIAEESVKNMPGEIFEESPPSDLVYDEATGSYIPGRRGTESDLPRDPEVMEADALSSAPGKFRAAEESKPGDKVWAEDKGKPAREASVPETVVMTEKEILRRRNKNRFIGVLVLLLAFALLFWFIPVIQEAAFKTLDNSLIFRSKAGLFGPRAGIIMIGLGILGLTLVFFTFFSKTREERLSKRPAKTTANLKIRRAGWIMALLIPLGITCLFNFTEFRTNDIRTSSVFNRNKLASYTEVSRQNVYLEGTNLIYEIFIGKNSVKVPISNLEPSTIRLLDTMMNSSRSIRIDSDVIKEVVAKKIYTEEEAVRVYGLLSGQ